MSETRLALRLRDAVAAAGPAAEGPWVAAVSGGLDSVVLLHLLRFSQES